MAKRRKVFRMWIIVIILGIFCFPFSIYSDILGSGVDIRWYTGGGGFNSWYVGGCKSIWIIVLDEL